MPTRVLTHQALPSGYTHVTMDAAPDRRPTMVLYTEHAADVLASGPHNWFDEVVRTYPASRGDFE